MTVTARRACWLFGWLAAATIYVSRHIRVYFCLPVSLKTKKNLAVVSQILCFISAVVLPGRQCMFIFIVGGSLMSGGVRRSSAANRSYYSACFVCSFKGCCLALCALLGFVLSEGRGCWVSTHTVSISALWSSRSKYLHCTTLLQLFVFINLP